MCYLCFSTSALLHQAPGHGAGDGEGLEERADEVAQADGDQLLKARTTVSVSVESKCECVLQRVRK